MSRLLRVFEDLAALFLLLIAVLVAINVTLRYAFSFQIPDWFDFSRQLQAIALFWGIAIATYRAGHICVDIVWEHMRPAGRRWLDLVATTITFLFLLPMAWMIWVKVATTGTQATSDLRLPLVPFYAVAATGATVAAFLAAKRIWDLWRRPVGANDEAENVHGP
jgi:TRAP-type C4-dicarboxylate transport system permease small subunit